MSDERSLFHGWRARTHYLTRNRRFLLRTAAAIIATGMIVASVIVVGGSPPGEPAPEHTVTPALSRLHEKYHLLRHESQPQPRQLAAWLRLLLAQIPVLLEGNEAEAYPEFIRTGELGGYDVGLIIRKHATSDAPAGLFQEYLAAALGGDQAAMDALEKKARAAPPEMLAAELLGSVQKRRRNAPAALQAFFTEGLRFADAPAAREEALHMAVAQRDLKVLRAIAAQPGWIEHCHPLLQHHAGFLLGDLWMQWRGLLHHRLNELPYGMLALVLFTAGLWYFILVQHSNHERWRWVRPVAPLVAGVASVWPTVTILNYQEMIQGMTPDAPFPHDLIYYVLGVGLREEACKLALFALFLPWLLWRRTPGLALLTGASSAWGFRWRKTSGTMRTSAAPLRGRAFFPRISCTSPSRASAPTACTACCSPALRMRRSSLPPLPPPWPCMAGMTTSPPERWMTPATSPSWSSCSAPRVLSTCSGRRRSPRG